MDVKLYQTIIEKTAVFPLEIGLAYCALGLNGEAGEVAEKVKKFYRDGTEIDKKALVKELGDVLWYLTAISNLIGVGLEEVMEVNYEKLLKRRATDTLHGSGDNREES
jgi:NTP pyrophosphatase (non-canonical NTP hydrolase)